MGRRRAGRPTAGGGYILEPRGWRADRTDGGSRGCFELQAGVSSTHREQTADGGWAVRGAAEPRRRPAAVGEGRGGVSWGPGQGGRREEGRAGSLPRPVASGWRAGPSSSPGVLPAPVAPFGQSWFPGTRQDIREATVPRSRPERLAGQRRWWGGRHTQRAQRGWGCAPGQELVEGGAWWRRRGPRNLGGLAPWT